MDKPKVDPERMRETYNFALLIGENQGVLADLTKVGRISERTDQVTLFEIARTDHKPGGP